MFSEDTRLRRDINKILLDLPLDRKRWRKDYWILYCGHSKNWSVP
jgi:hypothetical protein